jgi:two-component system chemotaxis response regulator CheY
MAVSKDMPILIVDDFKTMLRITRQMLAQLGFMNVTEATDGVDAIEKMGQKDFSLIISDWNMEPMSGYDLLKHVRGASKTPTVPFVMVTAERKPENVIAAKKAGVSNYIIKPFNAGTLKSKLMAVLGPF